jgi:hypothetical protein
MVYTRSEKSAVTTLLSLSKTPLTVTLYKQRSVTTAEPITAKLSTSKFWSYWSTWYHAFLSEATDDKPTSSIADRRADATSRWVTFASKKLHCSESDTRAWLRKADQKALVAAYA